MADLRNLHDEVDDDWNNEEEEQEIVTLDAAANSPTQDQSDDGDREQLDLPPALEEVEQKKYHDEEEVDIEEDGDLELGEDALEENEVECYSTLKRLWQQELACPELLPLDQSTLEKITEELEKREQAIAELGEQAGDMEALLGSVLKVDTDRARFMLSDLLRTRIWKIQEHPIHMRDLSDRMSDAEFEFLKGYGQLLESHLRRTVLDHIAKDALKNLDDPEMIDRPDLDQYVFVKVKETSEINQGTDDEPNVHQHHAGTTLIARYSVVRELFGQGKVELVL